MWRGTGGERGWHEFGLDIFKQRKRRRQAEEVISIACPTTTATARERERVHASERETAKERALCECVFVCGTYSGLVGELLYVCVPVYLARFYLRPAIPPARARG